MLSANKVVTTLTDLVSDQTQEIIRLQAKIKVLKDEGDRMTLMINRQERYLA